MFVIDVSSSMMGEKIELVRETLVFLLDELTPSDRVCLIKFGSVASQVSGFRSMTEKAKIEMKKVIEREIKVAGCTDLRGALNCALSALLSREEQNFATAVFFLSDGEDTCGNSTLDIQKELERGNKKMKQKNFSYQIHSFGFGAVSYTHLTLPTICSV